MYILYQPPSLRIQMGPNLIFENHLRAADNFFFFLSYIYFIDKNVQLFNEFSEE